jgi:hypothetical protein
MQLTEFKKFNVNDIVETLSKKDIYSITFINFAYQLRNDELDDKKQDNIIYLANIKIFITK